MDESGVTVKRIRRVIGLTQEKFAHELGVTVSTVNRWEGGHAQPSALAWRAIKEVESRYAVKQAEG